MVEWALDLLVVAVLPAMIAAAAGTLLSLRMERRAHGS